MSADSGDGSQPLTPVSESMMNSSTSLHRTSNTIDDLTIALLDFSRVPSPEPDTSPLVCCCGRDDCANSRTWLSIKAKLESRLTLSAKVGQALLKRHEVYVRKHERPSWNSEIMAEGSSTPQDERDLRDAETLEQRNVSLEKQLDRALINSEMAEAANKAIMLELDEARDAVARLTAHNARSAGWETRVATALQDRDDMQQERDSEVQRSKLAEHRISALNDRLSKMQTEVRRLQEDLEQRRSHHLESSESLLSDAKARLEKLYSSRPNHTLAIEDSEVSKVLEELVADNDTLKHDNVELQRLLSDSREEVRSLQDEVEEHRAALPPPMPPSPVSHRRHVSNSSVSFMREMRSTRAEGRSPNLTLKSQRDPDPAPLTPEMERRSVSPFSSPKASDALKPSDALKVSDENRSVRDSRPSSRLAILPDSQEGLEDEKPTPHKTLFLLTRSTGVQTDHYTGSSPLPSYYTSSSPHEGRSESSSLVESHSQASQIAMILERVVALLNRMGQADALTLTNRLRRHNLNKGADVSHLSRTTVSAIVSEVSSLRSQFRAWLEDDKFTIACTRKDLRVLFTLFRDVFVELGQMRVTLNDVILDPSVAPKVRDAAMNPAQAEGRTSAGTSSGGWMAPISKLFGASSATTEAPQVPRNDTPPLRPGSSRPPTRIIPKQRPALSASATTVNVEFSGTGIGRSVTSTFSAHPSNRDESPVHPATAASPPPSGDMSRNVMDIFAGAPRPSASPRDPWIVVPKAQKAEAPAFPEDIGGGTIRRSGSRAPSNTLSRQVDAMIDADSSNDSTEAGFQPLLQRTLRRRGLSDSSIHSTFTNQAAEAPPPHATMHSGLSPRETFPERGSVLQSLGKRVFRFGGNAGPGVGNHPGTTSDSNQARTEPVPGLSGLLPNFSSWASADMPPVTEPQLLGTPQSHEESLLHRNWERNHRNV